MKVMFFSCTSPTNACPKEVARALVLTKAVSTDGYINRREPVVRGTLTDEGQRDVQRYSVGTHSASGSTRPASAAFSAAPTSNARPPTYNHVSTSRRPPATP